jgi:hypothetical protein
MEPQLSFVLPGALGVFLVSPPEPVEDFFIDVGGGAQADPYTDVVVADSTSGLETAAGLDTSETETEIDPAPGGWLDDGELASW